MEDITSWTSIDLYYKGFHVKKSLPQNVNRVTLMAEIDDLIKAGFQPSWNPDTNKASVVAPAVNTVAAPEDDITVPCKECGGETTYREGVSKSSGKPWKAYFCKNKDHKPYFVK